MDSALLLDGLPWQANVRASLACTRLPVDSGWGCGTDMPTFPDLCHLWIRLRIILCQQWSNVRLPDFCDPSPSPQEIE